MILPFPFPFFLFLRMVGSGCVCVFSPRAERKKKSDNWAAFLSSCDWDPCLISAGGGEGRIPPPPPTSALRLLSKSCAKPERGSDGRTGKVNPRPYFSPSEGHVAGFRVLGENC